MVVRQAAVVVAAGLAIGLGAAFALTRVMRNLLFGVTATDLAKFCILAAALGIIALLASYIPALKAARVDPLTAMRQE
jgi:ABC-type antimicrobial peptide transport system permease subunit